QNQLVLALKSYGIWAKLDALYMNVNDASLEFSCLNWINPSLYAKDPLLWSWTSNIGLEKAFSAGDTIGYVPSTDAVNYALNDAFFAFKLGAKGATDIGSGDYPLYGETGGVRTLRLF